MELKLSQTEICPKYFHPWILASYIIKAVQETLSSLSLHSNQPAQLPRLESLTIKLRKYN